MIFDFPEMCLTKRWLSKETTAMSIHNKLDKSILLFLYVFLGWPKSGSRRGKGKLIFKIWVSDAYSGMSLGLMWNVASGTATTTTKGGQHADEYP